MTVVDVSDAIAMLADSGGAVVVQHGKAPLIDGRAGVVVPTLHAVSDVLHHPGTTQNAGAPAALFGDETLTVYLRREILPAVVDESEPWSIDIGGDVFNVEAVDQWRAGGFWVARCRRDRQSRQLASVFFGTDADGLEVLFEARAPSRSFRFVVDADDADDADAVVVLYPQAIEAPSDAVVVRAIDGGDDVEVTPTGEATREIDGVTFVELTLPVVAADDGSLRYSLV